MKYFSCSHLQHLPCPGRHTGGLPEMTTMGGTHPCWRHPPRPRQLPFSQQPVTGFTRRLSPPKDGYCVQRIEKSWYTRTKGFHSTRKKSETIHLQENGDYCVKRDQPASEGQILQPPPQSNVDSVSTFACVSRTRERMPE